MSHSLGRRAAGSVLWAGLGRAGRASGQIVFMLVLGRSVGPSGFAAASIALIGFQLVSTLASQSFSMALVRHREADPGRDATAFWLNLALSGFVVAVLCAVASPAARLLDLSDVAWLLPAVSLAALLGAPTGLAQARLSHSMDFRRVARIEAGASAVSAIAGVAAAWAGWGLWSLVVYATVQRVLELWTFLRVPGALPRVRPSRREAPALLRWTMPLVGVQVLTFASGSVDQVLVGRAADPTSLGLYSFGRRLTQQPTQMMTFAISRALFPALIHAADGAAGQGTLALRAMRLSVLAASGILFLLAAVAPDFVVVALGEEWRPAAPYVALFAAASAVLPIGAVFDATLRANGRTARQLLYQVLRFAVLVVVLSVMAAQGAGAWSMAVAVAVIGLIELLPGSIESAHALREPYRRIVAALVLGALPAALMYLALAALGRWAFDDLSSAARLALGLALGPVLWTALSWPTLRSLRRRPGAGLP